MLNLLTKGQPILFRVVTCFEDSVGWSETTTMGVHLESHIGKHYFMHFCITFFFAHYVMYVMNLKQKERKKERRL